MLGRLGGAWLDRLALEGVRRKIGAGTLVFSRGQRSALAFVISGRLDVVGGEVRDVTLRRLPPDSVVGWSTLAGAEHSADVIAGEDSEVLVFPATTVRGLLRANPELALAAIVHLAELVATLSDELDEMRRPELQSRVLARLKRLGKSQREVRVTHAALAAQVGASRANVSRALASLERDGHLQRHRGWIELI